MSHQPVVLARHGGGRLVAESRDRRGAIVAAGIMTMLAYVFVLQAYARAFRTPEPCAS
ncbi:MAG: hypothetical protein AAB297_03930 [Acidobacteriota bacterium]